MMAIAVCCYLKLSDNNKIRLYNKFYLEALAEQ